MIRIADVEGSRGTASASPPRAPNAPDGDEAAVSVSRQANDLLIGLSGNWRIERSPPRLPDLLGTSGGAEAGSTVRFETGRLGSWDSSILTFLQQCTTYCETHQLALDPSGLPKNIVGLLELARAVPEKTFEPERQQPSLLARLGEKSLTVFDGVLASVSFGGQVAQAFARLVTFRSRLRWRDFWVVVQTNGSGALPIVTLISFLVGLIIAFLGAVVLLRFGAGFYVSYLVGYGMLREMGALMTGIIIAGRTGAAFAAELGSMKITEEIDAYETLGLSPIDRLVVPRVLGLGLMMPLLTIYSMAVGIVGGLVVAVALLDLTVIQFMTGLLTPVTLSDGLLGVFKGAVFGVIIGVSGCMRGMQTGTDAGAVGRAATSAVVTGITLIIVANAVIDWLSALLQV